MRNIEWDKFEKDDEVLEYLKNLPRYKNTAIKSTYRRAMFFLNLLYCRLFRLDKPLLVVLVTNNKCDLNCSYCYGNYGERKLKDYSTKELLKIIDQLKSLGCRLLTLHGGESLLRKDIGEIFNYAKLKGFCISFNTNGSLVSKKIGEIRCVDTVCVSMDGTEESNDKNRGKGCYKSAMNAIDVLRQNNIPIVVHATLTRDNTQDMEFLAKLAVEKKFRIQYSILYNHSTIQDKCANLIMSNAEIRETVKKILGLKKRGYPVYYTENVLNATIDWPFPYDKGFVTKKDDDLIKKLKLVPCYHGRLKYQIDADGRVVTCWAHDYPNAPNIKKLGVAKAIKECHDRNICKSCAFLANNEQNVLMQLNPRNVLNVLRTQVTEAIKIK